MFAGNGNGEGEGDDTNGEVVNTPALSTFNSAQQEPDEFGDILKIQDQLRDEKALVSRQRQIIKDSEDSLKKYSELLNTNKAILAANEQKLGNTVKQLLAAVQTYKDKLAETNGGNVEAAPAAATASGAAEHAGASGAPAPAAPAKPAFMQIRKPAQEDDEDDDSDTDDAAFLALREHAKARAKAKAHHASPHRK